MAIPAWNPADFAPVRRVQPEPTPFARRSGFSVGFLGPTLGSHGGTESWHVALLPRLAKLGIHVGYATLAGDAQGTPARALRAVGVPTSIGSDGLRRLASVSDLIVSWGLATPRQFARDAAQPIVVVSHGDGSSTWTKAHLQTAAADAVACVAVSTAGLDTIPEARRASASVMHNAVDPARLVPTADRPTLRTRLHWSGPTALYLGRLSGEKRPALAIEALAELSDDWTLAIAGAGDQAAALTSLATILGVTDRIHWLGPRPDVGDLLHAADCCVCPSDTEGFGLAAAEALWTGCPLVACPVGFLSHDEDLAELVAVDAGASAWAAAFVASQAAQDRTERAREWARLSLDPNSWSASWALLLRSLAPEPASLSPPVATPARVRPVPVPVPVFRPTGGPGTEMHRFLARVETLLTWCRRLLGPLVPGFLETLSLAPDGLCRCVSRAALMDAWGPDGCELVRDEIVGWLLEAAKKRSLDCPEWVANWLLSYSIAAARRRVPTP